MDAQNTNTQKTVTVRSPGATEHETVVRPNDPPRKVLARAVGQKSEQMMLRKGTKYVEQDRPLYEQVQDGDEVLAVSNPVVG